MRRREPAQDVRLIRAQRAEQAGLRTRYAEERRATELRLDLQTRALDRRLKDLAKLEKRERASLERNALRDRRVQAWGFDGAMPSVAEIERPPQQTAQPQTGIECGI